jgi:polyvinyl alcohol dehydrogenase (cytochrome)
VVAVTRRGAPVAATLAVLALAIPSGAAAAPEGGEPKTRCSTADVGGGEWPSYGHDLRQTRFQPRERVISAADAPLLTPEWSFSTTDAGGEGDITGTPIVSRGCVYAATTEGWVFALNADDGEVVWKRELPYGGSVTGSVTAKGRRIFVGISRLTQGEGCRKRDPCIGPYVAALGRRRGGVKWATRSLDQQPGSDLYGSPMIFKRTLMVGVSGGSAELGDEADRYAFQGSMLFIDTRKGRLLRKNWTIHPPLDPDDEYAGAGIWSTPAIDRKAKVAYVGTANPFKPQAEHEYANAVVKFDLNRDHRRRFGRIIGSYKGNVDEYVPGLSELPCYDFPGNSPPYYPQGIGACGDIDLDFGAAPNLITGADGRTLVGAGQKSGVYHVFDAKTMEPVWTQIVGPPTAVGGIVGSTAYDGSAIYGPITVPGVVWSLAPGGAYRWAAPVGDGVHWGNPVAVANGVVYTVDLTGFLDAYDARSGAVLAKRPLMLGGSANPASLSWGGVSVARHMVFAAVGIRGLSEGHVIAFRRGGTSDVGDDVGETVGGLGGGDDGGGGGGGSPGGDPPIVAGPGAASTSYATPVATTGVGGPLDFVNVDVAKHDVTSVERGGDGRPLFSTPLIDLGERAPIAGLDRVSSGRSYEFFCTIHPGMRGRLAVR